MNSPIEVTIPNWHPYSLNKLLRAHWAARGRMNVEVKTMVKAWFFRKRKAKGKRRLNVEFVFGPGERRCDVDNLLKPLIDGLTACGMLVNDSPKWLDLGELKCTRGESKETRIRLEELAKD